MLWITQSSSDLEINVLVERILTAGQLNRWEYSKLMAAILSNHELSETDRHQINRIFDYVQIGRLKLVNF
ncbi:MAG: hypothetical protein WBA13_18955 [Microcoleaceae cyanobacterium]